jgi:hypothetical protein
MAHERAGLVYAKNAVGDAAALVDPRQEMATKESLRTLHGVS